MSLHWLIDETPVSKLCPPRTASSVIQRRRLINRIGTEHSRTLTLLLAPAGYGKTILLKSYFDIVAANNATTIWVNLDENDRTPVQFLKSLAAGLVKEKVSLIGFPDALVTAASEKNFIRSLANSIINSIHAHERLVVLIIDDFANANTPPVNDIFSHIINKAPSNLCMVCGTRSALNMSLGKIRAVGQLYEMHSTELLFSREETISFFQEDGSRRLSDEETIELHTKIDGWPAGLRLARQALRRADSARDFVKKFSASHLNVVEYLVTEILSDVSLPTREFLLRTSILRSLSPGLSAHLLEVENIDELIGEANDQLFLEPEGDTGEWYRYPKVIGDVLRFIFLKENPEGGRILHRRAYEWHRSKNRIDDAIYHAIQAGYFEEAADLIESTCFDTMKHGRVQAVDRWVLEIPNTVTSVRPIIQGLICWRHLWARESERAREILDEIIKQMNTGQYIAGLEAEKKSTLVDLVSTLNYQLCAVTDNRLEMARLVNEDASGLANNSIFLASVVSNLRCYSYVIIGRFDFARRLAASAQSINSRWNNVSGEVLVEALRGMMDYEELLFDEAEQHLLLARKVAVERRGGPGIAAILPSVLLSQLYYEMNEIQKSRDYLEKGFEDGEIYSSLETLIAGYGTRANLLSMVGKHDVALEVLAKAESIARSEQSLRLRASALAARIKILIALEKLQVVPEVLEELEEVASLEKEAEQTAWPKIGFQFITARMRFAIANGDAETAVQEFQNFLPVIRNSHYKVKHVSLLILACAAYQKAGKVNLAAKSLNDAFRLDSAEALVRTFDDEIDLIASVIQEVLQNRGNFRAFGLDDRTWERWKKLAERNGIEYNEQAESHHHMEQLSPRELEVIRALSLGQKNRDIASNLEVSESTVAWHLKNIFQKLHATNRTEALVVAKQNNMI